MHLLASFLKKIKSRYETNQSKLEVHHSLKKVGKITKRFEPSNEEDVIKKAFLDEKIMKMNDQ